MEAALSLVTLTLMEIVLGIDNIVFISILVAKLPPEKQKTARLLGLSLALGMRIGLLFAISWVMSLEKTLFTVWNMGISGRHLILLAGGLFLVAKATVEIVDRTESQTHNKKTKRPRSFTPAIVQILLLDIVFSLDSVITAVGMSQKLPIMIAAMVIAVFVMLIFSGRVSRFIDSHPSMRVLALAFLLLIGVMLVADGVGRHIPRGYVYFAMGFSLFVELISLWRRRRSDGNKQGKRAVDRHARAGPGLHASGSRG